MWGAGVQEERREVRADALAGQILRAVIEVNDKRRPSKKKKKYIQHRGNPREDLH